MRRVPVRVHVVQRLVDRPRPGRGNRAAAGGVPAVVAVGVVPRAARGVAAGDDVAHVEAAPGQTGQVAAVVEGEVFWVGDVVGGAGVLLVLRVALGAVLLFAGLLS